VVRSLALAGYLGSSGHLSMIVNLRHDATDINVVRSAMPLFGRSIILGVDTLTEALSRSLDINFNEALDMLPEVSLFNVDPADPRMGQAAQVARTVFGDITDELHRSLEFYKSQVGDVKVDQIILSGPGCMIPQLDQFIFTRMNIKTVICDPMRDLVIEPDVVPDSMRPILAALVGTSIEPSWNPSFTVDLDLNKEGRLPLLYDERKTAVIVADERPAPWFKPALTGAAALCLILLGVWAYLNFVDVPGKERDIQASDTNIQDINLQLKKLALVKQTNTTLTNKKKILDDIIKKSNHWSVLLEAVRRNIPPGVQLESIVLDNDVKIQGTAIDFSSISNFALNLSEAPGLVSPTIDYAKRRDRAPQLISFQITAQLPGTAPPPTTHISRNPQDAGAPSRQLLSARPSSVSASEDVK
jgi:Tfp pilus assembly protein PilN